jgi:DNA end-binding protein Ku
LAQISNEQKNLGRWAGFLKLSLVTCPIALYTATSSGERVAFRQISKKTGNRLRQQLIDEGTEEVIESGDKGRGYEVDKGVYLPIEDEEIEAIAIERHTIDIDRFVPKAEIDERYIDSPYYLIPNDKAGLDAFAVIRDAMHDKAMAALGRVVLSKRERVLMLQPWGRGLLGTTLRYPYEVRAENAYFEDIPDVKISKDMLELAEHILESKRAKFDASQFEDRYEQAIVELINVKKAGMPARPKDKLLPRVVAGTDLMAALRQSIAAEAANDKAAAKPASAAKPAGASKSKKKNDGQREMLLPITGSGRKAAAATTETKKPAAKTGARKAG